MPAVGPAVGALRLMTALLLIAAPAYDAPSLDVKTSVTPVPESVELPATFRSPPSM